MASVKGQRKAGKHNNLPAKGDPDAVHIPEVLLDHPERMEVFTLLVEDMKNRNIWSPTYIFVATEIAETVSRLYEARQTLDEEGTVIPRYNAQGVEIGIMSHPLVTQANSLQKALFTLIEKVGMSPKDIVFLTQTDPMPGAGIEAIVQGEAKKIVYFRD